MNLFPCLVTAADGEVYKTCRVHFDGTTTRAWWWDASLRDARPVVEAEGQPTRQSPGGRTYQLDTPEGTVSIRHLTGCGCGHPMKRWQLPKPVTGGGG